MMRKNGKTAGRGKTIFLVILLILLILEVICVVWISDRYDRINATSYETELKITDAVWFTGASGDSEQPQAFIKVELQNVSKNVERYQPNLYVSETNNAEDRTLSFAPMAYYETVNAAGVNNYDTYVCIPPGQTIPLWYPLTEHDVLSLEAMLQNSEQLYVCLPEHKAEVQECVPLQRMEIQTQ